MDRLREGGGWLQRLAPLVLFVFAVAVRALPWRSVFRDDRVLPFGNDAFYHMRRIAYAVRNFPDALDFDRYINFPAGAKPIWTPFLDWTTALFLRLFAGADEIDRFVVWLPPLLGGATVVALYFLARRHFGAATALLAALILSVLSGHFWYSQIGFVDHHAAVALASTGLLAAGMGMLSDRPQGAGRGVVAAVGLAAGFALLVWPGSLLHVGLLESALLFHLLSRPARAEAVAFANRFIVANGIAFLMVLPAGIGTTWPQWSRFSPLVAGGFQPWFFAALALQGTLCATLWKRPGIGDRLRTRIIGGVGAGAIVMAVSMGLVPGLMEGFADAWEWFEKGDGFQSGVAESLPLLGCPGAFTGRVAAARLSYFVFVFPLAVAVGFRALPGEHDRGALALLLWWATVLFLVTLVQKRFFNSLSVSMALILAWTVRRAFRFLAPASVSPRRRTVVGFGAIGVTLLLLVPVFRSYRPHVENQWRWLRGKGTELSPMVARQAVAVEMARWLRRNTPRTSGWIDDRQPEYGVMAPWPLGHVIEFAGRRPTVADGFGDDLGAGNLRRARRYYLGSESAGAEILERLRVRYVVAQSSSNFLRESAEDPSMLHSLYHRDGSAGAEMAPALGRHRLVYESRALGPRDSAAPSLYKIFEFVDGARITGPARRGERIRLTLGLRTNRKRRLVYEAWSVGDDEGRYTLRVPYATDHDSGAVDVDSAYSLECNGRRVHVQVREVDVMRGATIPGPALCGESAHGSVEPAAFGVGGLGLL